MITNIREVRRAKGLTLLQVAERCAPPTTAQTIGRLETGMRTVSVGWLNRIAAALGVTAKDLVDLPDQAALPVAAILTAEGADGTGQDVDRGTATTPGGHGRGAGRSGSGGVSERRHHLVSARRA